MRRTYEEKCAKNLGVETTAGSGAVNDDADFRYGEFLVEHKYRNKNTIWINKSWWPKIRKQAIFKNRKPAIIFENDECSVVYFQFGDLDLLHGRFELDIVKSPADELLKNENFIDNWRQANAKDKIYIIEYQPDKLMIMDLEDFKNLAGEDNGK